MAEPESTSSRASASARRKWYGGQYRRGSRAKCYQKAAAGVIRSVLQQLEETKVLEDGDRRPRDPRGQQDLDRIAGQVARGGNDE
ncbi:hypothetical protein JL722_11733 [Aureococcus anophagefferens]|nr:hypothetical protein JL722_11733 [Aureococcus anophagefferens]